VGLVAERACDGLAAHEEGKPARLGEPRLVQAATQRGGYLLPLRRQAFLRAAVGDQQVESAREHMQ